MLNLKEGKVLVRSRLREVTAKTYEEAVRTKDGGIDHINYFRSFHEHECWMTPAEAEFIVQSEENQKHIDGGFIPMYTYPMGAPMVVPVDFGGKLLEAPRTEAALATTDGRQADAARRKIEAAERALKAAEAQAGAQQDGSGD